MRTWRVAEPGELKAPTPLGLLRGMMALALAHGDWGRAAMLALMFHCLLRPGGAMKLVRDGLRVPGDAIWHAGRGVVVLRSPKTAKWRSQRVVVGDHLVVALCCVAWQTWPPTRKLVPGSTTDVEVWFQWAMRAGGATHEYLQCTTVEQLMYRGRPSWGQ